MRNVLLTGGAGFIGSHVAEALQGRGVALTIVDSLDPFYPVDWKKANLQEIAARGSFEFVESDIRDAGRMRELMERLRPDLVIHLAARAGVRPSLEQPGLYADVNVTGTVTLLELARQFGVRRFVFGSSSSVYGGSLQLPFSETQTDLRPVSPYAATKLAGEAFCDTYAHLYELPCVCLRFFTVYGPRQRPDLAIHKFTALIEKGAAVPVFGDGSNGRDYTHVSDIASGILAAAEYDLEGTADGRPFEIINLGNSHPVTLTELLESLELVIGRKAIRNRQPEQPGDVPRTWADVSKARRLLGYEPKTSFQSGLEGFVTWYRNSGISRYAGA